MILVEADGEAEAECVVLLNDSVVPRSAFDVWFGMCSVVTANDGLELRGFRSSSPLFVGRAFEWDFSTRSW